MTPVRLRLRNFLSYGEDVPELDLEGIHVACLSGGNGQGKSALLDAITWALWGEARKSADSRKPDDDLLRVGQREMEVELTFDLAQQRYRVRRSYTKTASGKSSKPGLEVQAQIAGTDEWRPLTEASIRETQKTLDRRLGVDYETFVNSTFLLQGRSDEFTRKKPTERKQILGRILDLGRYDRLHERAGRRYSEARETVKKLEAEAERLTAALEHEDDCKTEASGVETEVATRGEAVETARKEERDARGLVDGLERREADAARVRATLADLDARIARIEKEQAELGTRIEAAQALVDRGPQIEAAHARYEALRAERASLDEKSTLYHAVRAQLKDAQHDLDRARRDLEADVASGEKGLRADRERLESDRQRLGELERVEAELARATKAEESAARGLKLKEQRDGRQRRLAELQKRLDGERQTLSAHLTQTRKQIQEAEAALTGEEALRARVTHLASGAEKHAALAQQMQDVRTEGETLTEGISKLEAQQESLNRERAALEAKRQKVLDVAEAICPTCSTRLTDEHRAQVVAEIDADLAALDARQRPLAAKLSELGEQRQRLRARFVALKGEAEPLANAGADLARAEENLKTADQQRQRLGSLREDESRLDRLLAGAAFLPEVHAEAAELERVLETESFDDAAFERVRAEAAVRPRIAEERRKLLGIAERVEAETSRLQAAERDLNAKREALASGATLAPIRQRISVQQKQLDSIGFDAERFEAVQREMKGVEDAPALLARLAEATRSLRVDGERLAGLAEDHQKASGDKATQAESLAQIQAGLADRDALRQRLSDAERQRRESEAALAEAQTRLGALRERLARADRDRKALTSTRRDLREAKKQSALYYQLRVAFGKNGIPSLIIEETLPEIENRANDILERLARTRTRVALETLKDKKTGGGTKETLDIRITDDSGVSRPYETFSGGEAFRVNFALRIALSQMLAERAGTQVRTLVVDEGFGTQDKEGIAALVEAIRAIQDDFDTILVVTHLDEMKDAFPIRIEVTKRPVEGSTFEIVGV
ncbi:hypothetical protein BSZ36_04600 [Rubricoccus marinus]|uniref:Rad50/SbcC-type AAA domain-containing protein n=1 Tax=Rubricoccus marinus TaxID=716817 RepID=A0A259TXL9_9BACT|nr:hypothetical protein BSZ36_04600 [Rubricoccus marinus]